MTNYEEFKAIADDIAEMYANGYAEYAEYFSETYSGIGELSAVTRMSDKLYTLRRTDVKDPQYTTALKEIAIDAILSIGELGAKEKPEKSKQTSKIEDYAYMDRFVCRKPLFDDKGEPMLVTDKIYIYTGHGMFELSEDRAKVFIMPLDVAEKHLQKIIEKK
ncbi:MAG: hypothetical protein UH850_00635 [Paludibacteraceae bacterium]|nr:hypothetical protein [Paludibacteraceae bacterium]